MVAQHLQGDLVFLLRATDLVVQLGVVQGEAAVDGEDFEGVFVSLKQIIKYCKLENKNETILCIV